MAHYRVYQLNKSGAIVFGASTHHETDEAAIEAAVGFTTAALSVEVWSGARLVREIPCDPRRGGPEALVTTPDGPRRAFLCQR